MDDQKTHWDRVYLDNPEFFGSAGSNFARQAAAVFSRHGVRRVLELGAGQGRDTLFFASSGLQVQALDYADRSVAELAAKVRAADLASRVEVRVHDVRRPLPFADGDFDACYAHMLLCMQLTRRQIAFIMREIHRVLRPGGLALYSVRSVFDPHYNHADARHLGEQIYEVGGFVVHFFSEAMVRRFAQGFEITHLGRLTEGALPRDLFTVVLQKAGSIPALNEEACMQDGFTLYQHFFDSVYADNTLDKKTRFLVALGASLAAGCDTWAQMTFAVAKDAGASADELRAAAAIAMTVQATRIRNTIEPMLQTAEGTCCPIGAAPGSAGRTWGK